MSMMNSYCIPDGTWTLTFSCVVDRAGRLAWFLISVAEITV